MSTAPVRRLLRLAEAPVLLQQLRLVTDNIRSTSIGALLLVVIVHLTLRDDSNELAVNLWCALNLLVQINSKLILRHFDRASALGLLPYAVLHRIVGLFVLNTTLGGCLWGGLLWIAPADGTLAQTTMIVAVVAIVLSGGVSTVCALLPIFLALLVATLLTIAAKVGFAAIAAHASLAFAGGLYVLTLIDQAHKGAAAARASIQLRFENAALLDEVRSESAALHSVRREAEFASAAKSKVLAAASHDLRQPVHAQGIFLDLLARTGLSELQRSLLDRASASVAAQAGMLGTLFDFARIEAGVIEPNMEVFAVQPLLNKIEREFAPQADAKGLCFRSRECCQVVRSDPALVELILRNLVSNAIRYTDQGGLLVACWRRGGQAVLEVWDTGIGISPQDQHEVFREFHQLDDLERDRRKGFGLGLAIVDSLARQLEHPVSLASRPQRGSVFRLALPVSTHALLRESPSLKTREALALGAHVLVIEDDESIQSATRQLLNSWGYACEVGASIEEAVELAMRRRPDLVISDYRLNDQRSGLDAVVQLRAVLGGTIPALLVTGDTHPDRVGEAATHGIALLHKPLQPSQLAVAMEAALPSIAHAATEPAKV